MLMPGFRMIATIATILQSLRSISGKSETLNLNPDLFSFDRCDSCENRLKACREVNFLVPNSIHNYGSSQQTTLA